MVNTFEGDGWTDSKITLVSHPTFHAAAFFIFVGETDVTENDIVFPWNFI
jgi:hypothetical protein